MLVQYTGRAHVRELGKEDFKKAGVDAGKISFGRGETVEVPDPIGKQLLTNGLFNGEFKEVKPSDS